MFGLTVANSSTVNVVIFAWRKFPDNVGKTFHVGEIFMIHLLIFARLRNFHIEGNIAENYPHVKNYHAYSTSMSNLPCFPPYHISIWPGPMLTVHLCQTYLVSLHIIQVFGLGPCLQYIYVKPTLFPSISYKYLAWAHRFSLQYIYVKLTLFPSISYKYLAWAHRFSLTVAHSSISSILSPHTYNARSTLSPLG